MKKGVLLGALLAAVFSLLIFSKVAISEDNLAPDSEVTVKKIEVTGNFEVPDDEIYKVVTTKEGDKFSTEKLEQDLQYIFNLGYFSEDVKASLSEFEGGAKITFRVRENPVVSDVILDGITQFKLEDVDSVIKTKKNIILNSNSLREDVQAIEKKYHDAGFMAARVTDAAIEQGNVLRITVSEGTIQAIKISFLSKSESEEEDKEAKPEDQKASEHGKTKPYVITREMKMKVGDVYNTNKIGKDLQKIYNLGFFDDVHTRVEAGEAPGKIILVLEVVEAKTGSAGFGAGYSSNTGLTGFLTLSERNLKGKGRRADVKLEFGGKRNNFELGYFEPWLDRKETSLEVNVYNTSKENLTYGLGGTVSPDYEETRNGFNFTVGRPISDRTRVFVGFKLENISVEPEQYSYLNGSSRSVTGTLRTDTRDFVFNPTKGRYDSASLELNGGLLGGDYDYKKFILDLRRFHPLAKKQVLAARFNLGLAKGTIPRFDYFDLGGVNSLRGYEEYQFAGTKMLVINGEYRVQFSGNLSAVVFADAGNCWMTKEEITLSPGDLYKSVGVGLRLKIPQFGIGPVRLDYAITTTLGESKIHFGFGHMF